VTPEPSGATAPSSREIFTTHFEKPGDIEVSNLRLETHASYHIWKYQYDALMGGGAQ